MFYVGGEYDLCFGTAELLEFVDEVKWSSSMVERKATSMSME